MRARKRSVRPALQFQFVFLALSPASLRTVSVSVSLLNVDRSICMPFSTVLQWREIAAMATASRSSSSVAPLALAAAVVGAWDLGRHRKPDQFLGLASQFGRRI
jgi:hypothetical protein